MANKKSNVRSGATKTSSSRSSTNRTAKNKAVNELEKQIKKTNPKILVVTIVFIILGLALGIGSGYFVTRNDEFKILGDKEINIYVGGTYEELGAKAIAFGKEIDKTNITIEGTVDTNTAGTYAIVYRCNNFKYKNIIRVRYVNVLEVE